MDFGPAWHCYSGQRAAYASGPTLRDRRDDEQRGSPYDAKCNVAEIGAVNMGEIGAVRKRSRKLGLVAFLLIKHFCARKLYTTVKVNSAVHYKSMQLLMRKKPVTLFEH